MTGKTSTFTIHHDHCDPAKWTPGDVLNLSIFITTGSLQYAAALSRLGMQLVTSEHHEPKGGTLEHVGWAGLQGTGDYGADISDVACGEDVTAVVPIYRGPVEYVAAIPIGDGDGNNDGTDYEFRSTYEEASALFAKDQ